MPAPGSPLFEYRIDAVLGQGGFGVTYLATDVHLNAKVAIKKYLPLEFARRSSDQSVSPRWPDDQAVYQDGLDNFHQCFLDEVDWALALAPQERPRDLQAFARRLFARHAGSLALHDALHDEDSCNDSHLTRAGPSFMAILDQK